MAVSHRVPLQGALVSHSVQRAAREGLSIREPVAIVAAAASWLLKAGEEPEARWDYFTRVTETAGGETSPTLSPDGSTVAYAMRVNGSWDIYAQRRRAPTARLIRCGDSCGSAVWSGSAPHAAAD